MYPASCKINSIQFNSIQFNGIEFAASALSNLAATFRQCLSLIVSKLSTQDNNRNLGKASW